MEAPTQGTGIYFDGVSGRRQTVAVDLDADAIAISTPQGTAIARWPYADVRRMAAAEHRLRLGLTGQGPPARLSIQDEAFADAIEERLGIRDLQVETSERRKRHRVVEWSVAAVAALLLLAVAGMPSIADLVLPLVPSWAEDKIGLQLDAAERAGFKGPGAFACGEADAEKAGHAAFLKLIARLESAAGLPVRLRPVVVRDPKTVNASAGPGGYVFVQYGIIRAAETPEELAGILAHELGHVAHRDGVRGILRDAGTAYLFGIVLGNFFGSGAMFVSANQILHARHTRPQEAAADAYGAALMAKAEGDPHAMAAFFARLMKRNTNPPELLDDHPTNAVRVAAIRSVPAVANPKPFLTPDEWQALKRVCVLTDGQVCEVDSGDTAIAACTRAIASDRYKKDELGSLYYNRGYEYAAKDDLERAIADYDESIRLDPKSAPGFARRADIHAAKGDNNRAIADYSEAIKLDPKAMDTYKNRGRARLYEGALAEALADIKQAAQIDPRNAYAALWLDIANRRSKLASQLPQAVGQLEMTNWPAPVVRLYTGQLTPDAVLAAADDPDEKTKKRQVCDAYFYSGEWALQQGAKDDATRLFRLAAVNCPRRLIESSSANAELKALGATP
jgi:predicted Zn-dependent protease